MRYVILPWRVGMVGALPIHATHHTKSYAQANCISVHFLHVTATKEFVPVEYGRRMKPERSSQELWKRLG